MSTIIRRILTGGNVMKISEAYTLYEADKRLDGYSPHTLKSYRLQARLMAEALNDADITQLNTPAIKLYVAQDSERLKPASIGHRIRFIRSLFRWALESGIINGNPAVKLREPKQG